MNRDEFNKAYTAARNSSTYETFTAHAEYPQWLVSSDEDNLKKIYIVSHMTMRELIHTTGLSFRRFAEMYQIPARTIEGWVAPEGSANNRKYPEYVKILLAEKAGILKF